MSRAGLAALFSLALIGCKPSAPVVCAIEVPLFDVGSFRLEPEGSDPFAVDHQPDAGVSMDAGTSSTSTTTFVRGRCGLDDIKPELLGDTPSYSITTLFCSWGTLRTVLEQPIVAGEKLHLRIWYFSQQRFNTAEAKLEIRVDGKKLWNGTVMVPTSGSLIVEDIDAPFSADVGAELLWNVSNHGSNSWNFIELAKDGMGACPDAGP
ncbi:MAG: hypothetical protein U1E65_20345 [Myxococcota bacterium]